MYVFSETPQIRFNFEFEKKIDVGYIGCGAHSWRNIIPCFQYAPINLVATCDVIEERAKAYCKFFGAERYYKDYEEMLEKEDLDAVYIVAGYDKVTGHPLYPKMAVDAMRAGCYVWMEKPPAASVSEVKEMISVSEKTGKFFVVGFKTCFYPSVEKMKEVMSQEGFEPSALYVRYPAAIPTEEAMKKALEGPSLNPVRGFLDILPHPFAVIHYLGGKIKHIFYERNAAGGGFALMRFVNGMTGLLHFAAGMSGLSVIERFEVVGKSSNVTVDNGIKLTYYRPGNLWTDVAGYGRIANFVGSDVNAPIYWEPTFSRGELWNKNIFTLGYWGEVYHLADCCLKKTAPRKAGSEYALEFMKFFEAFYKGEGRIIEIN